MATLTQMDLKTLIRLAKDHYYALDQRQKLIMLLIVSFLVFVFGNMIIIKPLKQKASTVRQEVVSLQTSTADMQLQIDTLLAELESGLANPESEQSIQMREQRADLDAKLKDYYENLIPASQMGSILQQALTSEQGLQLITIRSLPAKEMLSYESAETGEKLELYRKGIEMVFEGGYFETIQYLEKLEGLKYKLLWGTLGYVVGEYPTARITIKAYTLSTEEGWIGG
jgi:MSHA biogenesis protein MshJ